MPRIPTSRQAFVRAHQGKQVDLGKLAQNAKAKEALAQAGVSVDKAAKAAGADRVLTAEEAYTLLEGISSRQARREVSAALGQLLGDASLQPIDRQGSVFGAMLSGVQGARDVAAASTAGAAAGAPPVDLGRPVTIVDGDASAPGAEPLVFVSAKTLEEAKGDLGALGLGSDPLGALGSFGPLGAYGPLGEMGPVGDNWWNPSTWVDSAYSSWGSEWDGKVDGGPLTEAGPLGEKGPLSDVYFDGALFENNEVAQHLRGLGAYNVLGPLGPLGPLGALGPLGPVGAHGFGTAEGGSYVDTGGVVQRTVDLWYDEAHTEKRTFELYEKYTEGYAKQMTDNDTSFMVEGRIAYAGGGQYETDEFAFTSKSDQLVSVAVVPEKQLDDFDFEITDQKGNVLLKSDSDHLIDHAQLRVKEGTQLKVRVKLKDSGHWLGKTYRLYVTGSTEHFNKTMADGPHVRPLPPAPSDTAARADTARDDG